MKDFSIESLNEFLSHCADDSVQAWSTEEIAIPFELKARDFLKFAEYDLTSDCSHHLINALSNIKRAIDCQLDSLLFGFGLLEKSKKENWSFPRKAQILNEAGVISPKILQRINQKRNLLEHEYKKPRKEQVEDALDVATLFIASNQRFLFNALVELDLFDIEKNSFNVRLSYKENKIRLVKEGLVEGKKGTSLKTELEKEVAANSNEYLDYLRWFVKLYQLKF